MEFNNKNKYKVSLSMYRILFVVAMTLALAACKKNTEVISEITIPTGKLTLIDSYPIEVTEPSGLAFGPDFTTLLTVSDNTNQVYEMDLTGNVLRVFDYTGKDLEGIAYNPDNNLIAIVEEADREVSLIDYTTGDLVETFPIVISFGSENKGLEGISYNANNSLYYIVNEAIPGLLVVWNPLLGIVSEDELDFAADYSGVFVDAQNSLLWFVSDESKSLTKCDYSLNVLEVFALDRLKYEGIVLKDNLLYLVNDATACLNIYSITNN
jgi:uncharacterized protein YjiK